MIEVIASVSFLAYVAVPEPQIRVVDKDQVVPKESKETQKPKDKKNKNFGRPLI